MDYKELNLIGSSSPHIRTKAGTGHIMGEVLLALLPALGFGIYNFGWRALTATLVSVAGCCFFEWLYRALMRKNCTVGDLSAAVTGVLIAFVCPVGVPYWILLIGDFFAHLGRCRCGHRPHTHGLPGGEQPGGADGVLRPGGYAGGIHRRLSG